MRVVLAEDHYLVREGTRQLLESSGEVDVVAAVEDAEALIEAVGRIEPEAVITDIRMPPQHQTEGIEAAHAIRADHPVAAIQVAGALDVLVGFPGVADVLRALPAAL